jgi:hypothetical protein
MAGNSKITYRCAGCREGFDTQSKLHKHMKKCAKLKKWLKTPVEKRSL